MLCMRICCIYLLDDQQYIAHTTYQRSLGRPAVGLFNDQR